MSEETTPYNVPLNLKAMQEDLICTKCGLVNDYTLTRKANNDVATCNGCGAWIKNKPYALPAIPFGKYKNIPIESIQDLRYLEWALKNLTDLKDKIKTAIRNQVTRLKFEGQ